MGEPEAELGAGAKASLPDVSRLGLSSAPYEAAPPPRIEGYRIEGCIGHGGMGTVWRAVQISTHRPVALKVMAERLFASEKARQRFEREVELAARLQHPHIARVYDSGLSRGLYYYAMEFIDGLPLDQFVARHQFDSRQILKLMGTIAQAVHHAHSRGVIHRDLKPSNILVDGEGQPHVLDFGLARGMEDSPDRLLVSRDGEIAGTLAYMSPEQAAGRADQIGMHSDVYSLGVMLYRLLLNESPHELSGSDLVVAGRIVNLEPRRPRVVQKGLSKELEAMLLKALDKEPGRRYATAGELGRDINNFLLGEPVNARPPTLVYFLSKWTRRNRGRVMGSAALILVLAVLGWTSWRQVTVQRARALAAEKEASDARDVAQKNAADNKRALVAAAVEKGMSFLDERQPSEALPWLSNVLVADAGNLQREWAHHVRMNFALREMPHIQQMWFGIEPTKWVRLLPGGNMVLTFSPRGWGQVWDGRTGAPISKPILLRDEPLGFQISLDGSKLLTWEFKTARVFALPSGDEIIKPLIPPLRHFHCVEAASIAPDGHHVLAITDLGDACLWDLATGEILKTVEIGERLVPFTWLVSPDGATITMSNRVSSDTPDRGEQIRRVWDSATARTLSAAVLPLTCEILIEDPQGDLVVANRVKGHPANLWAFQRWNPEKREYVGPIVTVPQSQIRLLYRGERYVVAHEGSSIQLLDLYTLQLHTIPSTNLTGRLHAYLSHVRNWLLIGRDDGLTQFWDAESGKPITPILELGSRVRGWAVSPDGKMQLTLTENGVMRLWSTSAQAPPAAALKCDSKVVYNADGTLLAGLNGDVVQVCDGHTLQPLISLHGGDGEEFRGVQFNPDSRWLAGISSGSLYVWTLPQAKLVLKLGNGQAQTRCLAVSPDGSLLAWSHGEGVSFVNTWTWTPVGPTIPVRLPLKLSFSPDGARIFIMFMRHADPEQERFRVWDISTGRPLTPEIKWERADDGGFTFDGKAIVADSIDGQVRCWDPGTGTELSGSWPINFRLGSGSPSSPVVDGNLILKSEIHGARLWDWTNGKSLTPCLSESDVVTGLAISADWRMLATSGANGARVWETATGLPLGPLFTDDLTIDQVQFNPDGQGCLTSDSEGVRFWNFEADPRPTGVLVGLGELLSDHRVSGNGSSTDPLPADEIQLLWEQFASQQ